MADPDDIDALSYEQLVDALESLITRMAAGDIGIEEVADLYERAGRLHAEAAQRLAQVRGRIEGLASAEPVADPAGPADPGEPSA